MQFKFYTKKLSVPLFAVNKATMMAIKNNSLIHVFQLFATVLIGILRSNQLKDSCWMIMTIDDNNWFWQINLGWAPHLKANT